MEGLPVHFAPSRPGLDEDVEMPSLVTEWRTLQGPPALGTSPSSPMDAGSSGNQAVVLHQSRRRRASGELTPYPDKNSQSSANGGWRPVRLQGYSEDPMKDEVIRGQTETIKLLQSQLSNLQKTSDNAVAADRRAREAEASLHREQTKAADQQELIEKLRNELRIIQTDSRRSGPETYAHQHIESPHDRLNSTVQHTELRSSSSAEVSMLLDREEGTDTGDESVMDPTSPSPNNVHGLGEYRSRATPVPLPLSFKKAGGRRRQRRKSPSAPPPVEPVNPSIWTNSSPSASTTPKARGNPATSLEDKLDLIISSLGIGGGDFALRRVQQGRHMPAREFRSPRARVHKAEGRNERLAWVRNKLQNLLGIKQDRDILNTRHILYAENAQLKHQMAQCEQGVRSTGPATLQPMQVNWDIIHGRWNECLLELFLAHCKENGYGDGRLTDEDEDEISEIFFKRLDRIRGIINEYRPKADETIEEADQRYSDKHLMKLSVARRNRRRGELFNARCDINIDHFPEDLETMDYMEEETKRWVDRYKINEAFGIEGTSSDETDPYDSESYYVHALEWRSKDLAKKMRTTDSARKTKNEYGNSRPGNRPRTRKRRSGGEAKESRRKPPSGLPINCYDQSWYTALSPKKKRELGPTSALQLLANWESD